MTYVTTSIEAWEYLRPFPNLKSSIYKVFIIKVLEIYMSEHSNNNNVKPEEKAEPSLQLSGQNTMNESSLLAESISKMADSNKYEEEKSMMNHSNVMEQSMFSSTISQKTSYSMGISRQSDFSNFRFST